MNVPPRGNFPIYPYVPHQDREGDMWQVRVTNHPLPHYIALYKTRKEALFLRGLQLRRVHNSFWSFPMQ
jgi:hypothetical protein